MSDTERRDAVIERLQRFCGTHEVAAILGISKQGVYALMTRDAMPQPLARLKMGPIWATKDIIALKAARELEAKERLVFRESAQRLRAAKDARKAVGKKP